MLSVPLSESKTLPCSTRYIDIDSCQAGEPRYYYDKETNTCRQYSFCGNESDSGNFKSIEDCNRACKQGNTASMVPLLAW